MFYGSNLYRKDNPRWALSNAAEAPKVPDAGFRLLAPVGSLWDRPVTGLRGGFVARVTRAVCEAYGIGTAWLIGLPRRAGSRLHAANDTEARWWQWQVTELCDGLVRQYRDARFAVLLHNPGIRRAEPGVDMASPDSAPPDCPCSGDL